MRLEQEQEVICWANPRWFKEEKNLADVKTLKEILKPRHFQMVELLAEGYRNKEIAQQVGVSEQVVKNNLYAIFDKAGCWSRHELAMRFIREQQEQQRACILQRQTGEYAARSGR